jgi:hypothetical protein
MSTNRENSIEARVRSMRALWLALLISIGLYYIIVVLNGRSEATNPSNTLSVVLIVIGLMTTALSFPIKTRLLKQAVERRQVDRVQQGYIVAWALTEVAALLGLIDFFVSHNRYCFILFTISAVGQLLHFPKREYVVNASFKRSIGG